MFGVTVMGLHYFRPFSIYNAWNIQYLIYYSKARTEDMKGFKSKTSVFKKHDTFLGSEGSQAYPGFLLFCQPLPNSRHVDLTSCQGGGTGGGEVKAECLLLSGIVRYSHCHHSIPASLRTDL